MIEAQHRPRVTGLRPEHCLTERFATYAEASPKLRTLNAKRGARWGVTQCGLCRGWHLQYMGDVGSAK